MTPHQMRNQHRRGWQWWCPSPPPSPSLARSLPPSLRLAPPFHCTAFHHLLRHQTTPRLRRDFRSTAARCSFRRGRDVLNLWIQRSQSTIGFRLLVLVTGRRKIGARNCQCESSDVGPNLGDVCYILHSIVKIFFLDIVIYWDKISRYLHFHSKNLYIASISKIIKCTIDTKYKKHLISYTFFVKINVFWDTHLSWCNGWCIAKTFLVKLN